MTLLKIFFKDVSHYTIKREPIVRCRLIVGRGGSDVMIPVCAVSLANELLVQFINSVSVDERVIGWVPLAKGVIILPQWVGKFCEDNKE